MFTELSVGYLRSMLECQSLACDEEDVLVALCTWLEYNCKISTEQRDQLVSCLRFGMLNMESLSQKQHLLGSDKVIYMADRYKEYKDNVFSQPLADKSLTLLGDTLV